MQSKAATVAAYLKELSAERRTAVQAVRRVILDNLDAGFEEGMHYGMIGYSLPHRVYPAGYHCDPKQPLPYAGLASQKQYVSIYLMGIYTDAKLAKWFEAAWKKTGKKLDMGKCCVRFRKLEDVALDVVGEAIARVNARDFIALYEKTCPKKKSTKPRTRRTRLGGTFNR